ncbi:hypothetical protein MASR2M47_09280 [Draconibacterium sp.]
MKKSFFLLTTFSFFLFLSSCEKPWQPLFNGENLDGWDTWVGPLNEDGESVGLNKDPLSLFTVVDLRWRKGNSDFRRS